MTITHIFGSTATKFSYAENSDKFGTLYNSFFFCGNRVHTFKEQEVPMIWMTFDSTVSPTVIKIDPLDATTSVGSHTI